MDEKLEAVLTELQRSFKKLYHERLVRLVLFGSHARGEAEQGSDIDILVVLHGPVRSGEEIARTGETIAVLSLEYDVVISCVFVSADRYSTEQSPLLMNVRREGVTV